MTDHKRIFISTGEASGDMHAAALINDLNKIHPNISYQGVGSTKMRECGVDIIHDCKHMSVIGLVEIFAKLPTFVKIMLDIRRCLRDNPPDLLILIDNSGFNLRLAKYAKSLGIKILYYICPQIWASRPGRIETIKQSIDMMAVTYPFEVPIYQKAGVAAKYVGQPLTDKVVTSLSKAEAYQHFKLDSAKAVIGLMPGSRRSEIKSLLPTMLESAKKLQQTRPELQFVLPVATTIDAEQQLMPLIKESGLEIQLIYDQHYDVIQLCETIIVASGSATLEIAMLGIPMVVIYRVNSLTFHLALHFVHIPDVSLCNVVAQERIVPELIQFQMRVTSIVNLVERFLDDKEYAKEVSQRLLKLRHKLVSDKNRANLAELVNTML